MKNRTVLAAALVLLGSLVGIVREICLSKYFGANEYVDAYRISSGLPLALSQGFALSYVNYMFGTIDGARVEGGGRVREAGIRRDVCNIFLFGLLTIPVQMVLFSPEVDYELYGYLLFISNWVMFLCVGMTFGSRFFFVSSGIGWAVPLFQLLRNVLFIIITASIASHVYSPYALAIGSVASSVLLPVVSLAYIKYRIGGSEAAVPSEFSGFGIKILSSLLFIQLLYISGRLFDRSVASTLPIGSVSILEYSYSIIMSIVALLGTSVVLTALPKIEVAIKTRSNIFLISILMMFFALSAILSMLFSNFVVEIVFVLFGNGEMSEEQLYAISEIVTIQLYGVSFSVVALVLVQRQQFLGKRIVIVWFLSLKLVLRGLLLYVYEDQLSLVLIAEWFVIAEAMMCGLLMVQLIIGKNTEMPDSMND